MDEIKNNLGTTIFKTSDGRLIGQSDLKVAYNKFKCTSPSQVKNVEAFTRFIESYFNKSNDSPTDLSFEHYLPIRYGIIASILSENSLETVEALQKSLDEKTARLKAHCENKNCPEMVKSMQIINDSMIGRIKSKKFSSGSDMKIKSNQSQQNDLMVLSAYQDIESKLFDTNMGNGLLDVDSQLLQKSAQANLSQTYQNIGKAFDVSLSKQKSGGFVCPVERPLSMKTKQNTILVTKENIDQLIKEEEALKIHSSQAKREDMKMLDKLLEDSEPSSMAKKIKANAIPLTQERLQQLIKEEDEHKKIKANAIPLTQERLQQLIKDEAEHKKIKSKAMTQGKTLPIKDKQLTEGQPTKLPFATLEEVVRSQERLRSQSASTTLPVAEKAKGWSGIKENHAEGEKDPYENLPLLTKTMLVQIAEEEKKKREKISASARQLTKTESESLPMDKQKSVAKKLLKSIQVALKEKGEPEMTFLLPKEWIGSNGDKVSDEDVKKHVFVGDLLVKRTAKETPTKTLANTQFTIEKKADGTTKLKNEKNECILKNEKISIATKSGDRTFSVCVIEKQLI